MFEPILRKRLLLSATVFFLLSLIVLSGLRLAFFYVYRSPDITFETFVPALLTGIKADAKWLALLIVPGWVLTAAALFRDRLAKYAAAAAVAGFGIMLVLDLVNFGFFGFYRTPISPIVFGLFEDDTAAIIRTVMSDQPVFAYLGALAVLLVLPVILTLGICRMLPEGKTATHFGSAAGWLFLTLLLAGAIRGSFGTFPLRTQDFSVSPVPFINATVPNGAAALYEAFKGRKALRLNGAPDTAFHEMGFASREEAEAVLLAGPEPAGMTPAAVQPHVVLAVMESMGRDLFEAHRPGVNDMLGRLEGQLAEGTVFLNGISVENGTFPSLEGLLFDTPYTPLTQSRYGSRAFSFSHVRRFRDAGWKTVFLTAGPEGWRQMDVNFPRQGFDEVIGSAAIRERFPEAEMLTWGIGDEWMFRTAETLIEEADKKGEKLFIVMLSATNHGPYRVPDGTETGPVSADVLPDVITADRRTFNTEELRTYRYAADAMGGFVGRVRAAARTEGHREVLIAATGDHNGRYSYRPDGFWHHAYGVPLLFWLPESLDGLRKGVDASRLVGHRDIFPTLEGLVFGGKPALHEGRNLFAGDRRDLILSYMTLFRSGFAVGADGLVMLDGPDASCFRLKNDRFVTEKPCSPELTALGNAARAQRALAGFKVRSGLAK